MSQRTDPLRRGILGALLLLFACSTPRASSPEPELRVMAYNIRYGTADDGQNRWELRRDLAIDVLREHRPHIAGLQEALRFQLDEIDAALPNYAAIGVGRDDGGRAGEYVPILYDSTVVERIDAGWFWFSDTPDVPGSKSWGNDIPRIATWGRFRDRRSGKTFVAYNVHFDHQSQPSRERSAALLLRHIGQHTAGDPVLVTGDFNAGESNTAFTALVAGSTGLRDTFRTLFPDADSVGTFHAFRGGASGDKIDAVLADGDWDIVSAAIVHMNRGGRYPSDHYPVLAVVRRRTP